MVSVIIPARNEEASVARTVESVAAQPEIHEIIVVNDQSTDRTGAILAKLSATIPKLKIMNVETLPDGWVGKNYAVSLGASVAEGDWLLFTDADTYHMLGSTRRALADAVDHDAVLVSYSPEQELGSFWERALIPVVYSRLAVRYPFAKINDPNAPDAAANGQFLMILRDVYEKVGGHAAISNQVLEDVALAQRVKSAGYRIYFTAPLGIVQTRMYRSFAAMWQGWTKNLYALMGGTPKRTLAEIFAVFPVTELVLVTLVWWASSSRYRRVPMWPLFLLLLAAWYVRGLRANSSLYGNPRPLSAIKYHVPGTCLYIAALLSSWWKNTQGRVLWKGRSYPPQANSSSSDLTQRKR
jgi:glycosyltransferase involved in cell wall biosynthesis